MGADEPVYDERGNVRPRGTEGARPMTLEERVAIAQRIGAHEGTSREVPREARGRKRAAK